MSSFEQRVAAARKQGVKPAPAPKPAPTKKAETVADVIAQSGADAQHFATIEAGVSADVLLGQAPTVTQRQIREAHRAAAGDGEISDREETTVLDVLRAASAAARGGK